MKAIRIIMAMVNEAQASKMRSILNENGFNVIDISNNGHDCIRRARTLMPDLAIVDFDLLSFTGFETSKVLCEDGICSAVLIANESQKALIDGQWDHENFICLVKPLNRTALITAIELIVKNNRRIRALEKEIIDLKDSMEARKLVEKAKGVLMKVYNISEEEAFRRIQKRSMDEGIPMKELAQNILIDPTKY